MSDYEFIIPPDKRTGALIRTSRPGENCSLFGERMEVLPDSEISRILQLRIEAAIRGREDVTKIKDQGQVGSCACEQVNQGGEVTRKRQGLEWIEFNPYFMYYTTSGGSDRGSTLEEDLIFARDVGLCPESIWPRSKGWRTKPSAEAYAAAKEHVIDEFYDVTSIQEIKTALVTGWAVGFGHDSHSELMVDLLSLTVTDVANSWGNYSGSDNGFHKFPLSRVNFAYGAYAYRTCT